MKLIWKNKNTLYSLDPLAWSKKPSLKIRYELKIAKHVLLKFHKNVEEYYINVTLTYQNQGKICKNHIFYSCHFCYPPPWYLSLQIL